MDASYDVGDSANSAQYASGNSQNAKNLQRSDSKKQFIKVTPTYKLINKQATGIAGQSASSSVNNFSTSAHSQSKETSLSPINHLNNTSFSKNDISPTSTSSAKSPNTRRRPNRFGATTHKQKRESLEGLLNTGKLASKLKMFTKNASKEWKNNNRDNNASSSKDTSETSDCADEHNTTFEPQSSRPMSRTTSKEMEESGNEKLVSLKIRGGKKKSEKTQKTQQNHPAPRSSKKLERPLLQVQKRKNGLSVTISARSSVASARLSVRRGARDESFIANEGEKEAAFHPKSGKRLAHDLAIAVSNNRSFDSERETFSALNDSRESKDMYRSGTSTKNSSKRSSKRTATPRSTKSSKKLSQNQLMLLQKSPKKSKRSGKKSANLVSFGKHLVSPEKMQARITTESCASTSSSSSSSSSDSSSDTSSSSDSDDLRPAYLRNREKSAKISGSNKKTRGSKKSKKSGRMTAQESDSSDTSAKSNESEEFDPWKGVKLYQDMIRPSLYDLGFRPSVCGIPLRPYDEIASKEGKHYDNLLGDAAKAFDKEDKAKKAKKKQHEKDLNDFFDEDYDKPRGSSFACTFGNADLPLDGEFNI